MNSQRTETPSERGTLVTTVNFRDSWEATASAIAAPKATVGLAALLSVRASGTPLAFRCPASIRPSGLPISESSEPADLGSATHEALRPLAEGGSVQWDDLPRIAGEWGVEIEDLRMLCAMGTKLWPEVAASFAGALTEVPLSHEVVPGTVLTGHLDLLAITGTVARAADWKTGRKDHDYSHQMRAYGTLVLLEDPSLTEVTVTILWLRDGTAENYTIDRPGALAWVRRLRAEVIAWDGTYHPSPKNCAHCPRSHECAAASALIRRDVSAFVEQGVDASLATMAPGRKLALYRSAAMVEQYAKRVRAALRADVEEHGPIEGEDGTLAIVVEPQRELVPLAAWPVLEGAGFGDAEFTEVLDLSISKVEKLVATRAGKGKGAAAVRALRENLTSASALRTRNVQKLVDQRKNTTNKEGPST